MNALATCTLISFPVLKLPAQEECAYVSLAVTSWIHCHSCVCFYVCAYVVSENAGSPAASGSKCSRINWGLLSYLGPTAVPETEESDEALFCRV